MQKTAVRKRWLCPCLTGLLVVLAALSCLLFRKDFQAINGLWYRKRIAAYLLPAIAAFGLSLLRPVFSEKRYTLVRTLFAVLTTILAADVFQRVAWYEPKVLSVAIEPRFVLVNLSITAIVYAAVWALVWDCRIASVITFWLMALLGYAYSCVLVLRGTVFQLSDLTIVNTAFSVMDNYQLPFDSRYAFWLMVGMAWMVVAGWVPGKKSRSRRAKAGKLVCLAAAGCWLAILLCTPLLYSMGVVTTTFQADAIYYNAKQGALTTLMKEAWELGRNKPESYSVQTVSGMDERLMQEGLLSQGEERPNVLVVMVESLTDYTSLYQMPLNEEPLPFLKSLKGSTVYGNLYSSAYGGQTSNIEFGFLTGVIPIPNRVTYMIKDTNGTTPSFAWQLKAQGYQTFAIHPENKNNYQRSMFYPLLGLDTFLHRDSFTDAERIHTYVSDQACYEQIISLLDGKKPDDRYLIFTVTMQNHGGYQQGDVEERIWLTGDTEHPELVEYLNCARHSDEALAWLFQQLEQYEEPTLLLVFGDHQPALDLSSFSKQEGLTGSAQQFTRNITPFVIWANYPIEPEYVEAISVNYLAAFLADKGGLSMTGYDIWLLDVMKQYPAAILDGYVDAQYAGHGWDADESQWPVEMQQLNHLRYNRLFDEKNRLPALKRISTVD